MINKIINYSINKRYYNRTKTCTVIVLNIIYCENIIKKIRQNIEFITKHRKLKKNLNIKIMANVLQLLQKLEIICKLEIYCKL